MKAYRVLKPYLIVGIPSLRRANMGNHFKTGEKVPISGQYNVLEQKGGRMGEEITAVKGKRFPPSRIGTQFELDDQTKHSKK